MIIFIFLLALENDLGEVELALENDLGEVETSWPFIVIFITKCISKKFLIKFTLFFFP